jgi:RimJ/RimL family protein N-acetyltransferase
MVSSEVSLRPYAEGDMWILERTLGDPHLMVHLNGPESLEKIRERHRRFVTMTADPHIGCSYTIMVGASPAGNVGYCETDLDGEKVWETGWFVLPEFQGRGVATEATRQLIDVVSRLEGHRFLVAFPSVSNAPSNAIPKKLDFKLARKVDSEYPPGSGKHLQCNVWRLALPVSPRKK